MTDEEMIEWALVGIKVAIRTERKEATMYNADPQRLKMLLDQQAILEGRLRRVQSFRDDSANLEADSPLDGSSTAAEQVRERQVKHSRWSDIDVYTPEHHPWRIGDELKALRDAEFSWGWSVSKGNSVNLRDNTSLWQLDFKTVTQIFVKVN